MAYFKSCLLEAPFALLLSLSTGISAQNLSVALPGAHRDVVFSTYPSIATSQAVVARLLSPIATEAVRRRVGLLGKPLQREMFDISRERYMLYVPRHQPPGGYGLLVFIPPWPQEEIPEGWAAILDKFGVIFLSAARSGNEEKVLERRVPLALAGLADAQSLFRIDPSKTFVGGFSGGARVAMRLALAYPDKFAGVLLNAGSDPIAQSGTQLPSPDLFRAFQTRMKIAYVTGERDEGSLSLDVASRSSMQHWCVNNLSTWTERSSGHEIADPQALNWALKVLLSDVKPDSKALAACRASRDREVDSALVRAQQVITSGQQRDAYRRVLQIDETYGGLAAPTSIRLADRCSCGLLDHNPKPIVGDPLATFPNQTGQDNLHSPSHVPRL